MSKFRDMSSAATHPRSAESSIVGKAKTVSHLFFLLFDNKI